MTVSRKVILKKHDIYMHTVIVTINRCRYRYHYRYRCHYRYRYCYDENRNIQCANVILYNKCQSSHGQDYITTSTHDCFVKNNSWCILVNREEKYSSLGVIFFNF